MTKYIKITDQACAFDCIEKQDWTPHYKSIARYRWKVRHAPETIKRRVKECPICYENHPHQDFENKKNVCRHFCMICKTCLRQIDTCPFCREQWKPRNVIIFRVTTTTLLHDDDVFNQHDLLDTVVEILRRHISP